ncbi:unnamed protein product, partial [Closterium sp. NIES-53]
PPPEPTNVSRFLVAAEATGVAVSLVFNKADLVDEQDETQEGTGGHRMRHRRAQDETQEGTGGHRMRHRRAQEGTRGHRMRHRRAQDEARDALSVLLRSRSPYNRLLPLSPPSVSPSSVPSLPFLHSPPFLLSHLPSPPSLPPGNKEQQRGGIRFLHAVPASLPLPSTPLPSHPLPSPPFPLSPLSHQAVREWQQRAAEWGSQMLTCTASCKLTPPPPHPPPPPGYPPSSLLLPHFLLSGSARVAAAGGRVGLPTAHMQCGAANRNTPPGGPGRAPGWSHDSNCGAEWGWQVQPYKRCFGGGL